MTQAVFTVCLVKISLHVELHFFFAVPIAEKPDLSFTGDVLAKGLRVEFNAGVYNFSAQIPVDFTLSIHVYMAWFVTPVVSGFPPF